MPDNRKYIDCRDQPSVNNCSLRISGREDEVVRTASHHAITDHGHAGGPGLDEAIRGALKDEETVAAR